MIIINGRFLTQRVTGVQRFAREITAELDTLIKPGELVMAVPPETEDIPEYKNISVVKVGRLHNSLWEHISLPIYVKKNGGLSLNLCNVAPLPAPGIVCIHDVKIKACPSYFTKRFLLWYRVLFYNETKRAKKIITVSEFSKRELIKYYHIYDTKVIVIPDAWQHYQRVSFDETALKKYGLQKDGYYFSMSSLEPNKNFMWIAEAARNMPDKTFAVAGSINSNVFSGGPDAKCPENMKFLGYVSDEEAKTLMRESEAFLFPTFYEGFGIPPLEALSAGCKKIVVSDTGIMREIFEDCAVFVNPDKFCANQLENGRAVSDGMAILGKYSWKRSARLLLEELKSVD